VIGVRVRDGGFEGRCDYCHEYLPLSDEFWPMKHGYGLRRCRACLREYKAAKQLGYVMSRRDLYNANVRARMAFLSPDERARRNAVTRAWKAANRERIAAYNLMYRQRRKAA
jgi:hypothetical protein